MDDSSAALAKVMATLRSCEAVAMLWELLFVVKSIEPSIIAHIKQANIRPNGGSSVTPSAFRALTIAEDQKKTNRYIIDSKSEDAVASANTRLSGIVNHWTFRACANM